MSNSNLTATNKLLTEQLRSLLEANTLLIKKLSQNNSGGNKPTIQNERRPFDQQAWEASLDPKGYCWTHGYKVQKAHTSAKCKGKLGGHQDAATRDNIMGGSTKGLA